MLSLASQGGLLHIGHDIYHIHQTIAWALQVPPTPPVDPDNAEFVLFIRAKKFPQWYPLSVVKGGSAANTLIRAMEYDFGKLLYGKTLIRNIGQVCRTPSPAQTALYCAATAAAASYQGHCSPSVG